MSLNLTKYQKQGLGNSLRTAGYTPEEFVYSDDVEIENKDYVALTCRESSDRFLIRRAIGNNSAYYITLTTPGTDLNSTFGSMPWDSVEDNLTSWAKDVKRESEAVDPWKVEAEDLANDDSYFTLDELPKVDRAIEESLNKLRSQAIEHGKSELEIRSELDEIKQILLKSARNSTKKEWTSIFKGVIVGKLIDWGMQTQIYQDILQTLVNSAHEVTQLTEHISKHLAL